MKNKMEKIQATAKLPKGAALEQSKNGPVLVLKAGTQHEKRFHVDNECAKVRGMIVPLMQWVSEKRFTRVITEDTGRVNFDRASNTKTSVKFEHKMRIEVFVRAKRLFNGNLVTSRRWTTSYWMTNDQGGQWISFFPCPEVNSDGSTLELFADLIDDVLEYLAEVAEDQRAFAKRHFDGGIHIVREKEKNDGYKRTAMDFDSKHKWERRDDDNGNRPRHFKKHRNQNQQDRSVVAPSVQKVGKQFLVDPAKLVENPTWETEKKEAEEKQKVEQARRERELREAEDAKKQKVKEAEKPKVIGESEEDRIRHSDEKFVRRLQSQGVDKAEIKRQLDERKKAREDRRSAKIADTSELEAKLVETELTEAVAETRAEIDSLVTAEELQQYEADFAAAQESKSAQVVGEVQVQDVQDVQDVVEEPKTDTAPKLTDAGDVLEAEPVQEPVQEVVKPKKVKKPKTVTMEEQVPKTETPAASSDVPLDQKTVDQLKELGEAEGVKFSKKDDKRAMIKKILAARVGG